MARFRNNYECPCGETWSDESDYTNNDRCPSCNKEIEPTDSDDLEAEFDVQNIPLLISARQRDVILCGLRNLQRTCGAQMLHGMCDYDRLPFELRDILTGGDEHSPAEANEIDDLCEAINIGRGDREPGAVALLQELVAWEAEAWDAPDDEEADINGGDAVEWLGEFRERVKTLLANAPAAPEPARIIVVLEGGVIAGVACDRPARVLALDADTEGCDDADLKTIDGERLWASLDNALPWESGNEAQWADGLIVAMEKLNANEREG